MDTETGEIRQFKEDEKIPEGFVKVFEKQMTNLQKQNMQISKYDNKSELGKLYTSHRKLTRKQRNRRKRRDVWIKTM